MLPRFALAARPVARSVVAPARRDLATKPAVSGLKGNIWLSDPGTYPIGIIIGGAVVFCFTYYAHNILTNPDIRISKERRHTVIRTWEMSPWGHH